MIRNYHYIALLLYGTLLTAGCSPGEQQNSSVTPEKLTIAVIPKGATHEHWKSVHIGAQKAASELGIDIIWKGPIREDDREEQLQIYETFIARKVNAICIAPIDDRVFIRPVREAKALGIPTVVFDSALQENEHISFVSTDNYRGGVLGAQRIAELLDGKGRLIMMRYQEGSAATAYREQGFLDTIMTYPGIEILSDNQYSGATTESAYQASENILNRFPEFEAIWMPNESSTFGCLRALQNRGLAGKIVFVGFDTSTKLVEALRTGEIQGLSLQNPLRMGYLSVATAAAYLKGEKIGYMIDTGVTMATPENMDNPDVNALLMHDWSAYLE
ncbi:substrate-binding domain-containing protein [Candidatus Latescibacterota bacterium]